MEKWVAKREPLDLNEEILTIYVFKPLYLNKNLMFSKLRREKRTRQLKERKEERKKGRERRKKER